ncbi:hypothetical protein BKA82DRAFT_4356471 [Pisolithus tinctorius]|nr:hypothetical protein BKA82DRAFT_4356471 [Pisolithus tinctorius]
MFPQPRFSSLVPTPVEGYDASACYLHYDLEDSDCFPPDEDLLGKRTNSLPPDGSIHYDLPEQPRTSDAPAGSGQSAFRVDYLQTATAFGHQDSVQGTANHYSMSHLVPSYFPAVGSVAWSRFKPLKSTFPPDILLFPKGTWDPSAMMPASSSPLPVQSAPSPQPTRQPFLRRFPGCTPSQFSLQTQQPALHK